MPLTKKIVLCFIFIILVTSSFSGCILDDLFSSTSFTLKSWSIYDDEGFPSLNLSYSCDGKVTIKLFGPGSSLLDSDFFFRGSNNTVLHMSDYRHSVTSGQYKLKAYNGDDEEIYSKSLTFGNPDLTITSCEQQWWMRDLWSDLFTLLEFRLLVYNIGNTPAYPYAVITIMDSVEISGGVFPCVIMPGTSEYIDCFIYKYDDPEDSIFTVNLINIDYEIIATNSFSINKEKNVQTEQFNWAYNGNHQITIPKPEYLYDFQKNLDRINDEDYSYYIFDPFDDEYMDLLNELILVDYSGTTDVGKINFVAAFVQNLEYKSDSDTNLSYEYPNFPVETLFTGDGGGDCEDKAILTASLLYHLGYNVSLLRFPNHMAVGVQLDEGDIPAYDFFIDDYYFLETTTAGKSCGFIPSEYRQSSDEVTIYPITTRPLLVHSWKGGSLVIYTNTEMGDFVKLNVIVENNGIETAYNIVVEGAFFTLSGSKSNFRQHTISSLDPGMKEVVQFSINIPKTLVTVFKTRLYLDGEVVDERESSSTFPTS